MRTTSSRIHIRSDDDEKNIKGGAASLSSLSPPPLFSLSLFLFPSLSEEAIQVVDLPQAGVGPHTQDTPFKILKKPSNFSVQSALADQKRNERPSTLDSLFISGPKGSSLSWISRHVFCDLDMIMLSSRFSLQAHAGTRRQWPATLALAKTDSRRGHAWQT